MAAAGISGCGLKRHCALADHEEKEMMKDQCGRFWNGMDLLKDVTENKHFLPTGLEGIDTLLGGGLRQGQVTEITGPSSSGKTQVCLHSASYVAARHMGAVMYLDTSNSFSPSRIANITDELPISLVQEPRHVRLKRAMSSIICESVFDIFALFEVLHRLELSLLNDKVNNVGSKVCLLIIDSISSLLAPIIGGKYLQVQVTNHMVSAGNGALKPALGESWKAVPHVRLVIFRDHGSNICTATVLKHTLMASGRPMKFVVPS
ncbi:DNA repair protein RAD51 homolog 4 isoform X2 [Phragmites australis]|uniref:DNA repair protein RAD51 homolog 4 isoform X2 n=1 Tax=Phragmites australis TaxID=29695 RepID=UPI002D7960B3|nr:DNA repair protein RAD51 homolog 4 isoform X2 [Phragmites australis]